MYYTYRKIKFLQLCTNVCFYEQNMKLMDRFVITIAITYDINKVVVIIAVLRYRYVP